MRTRLLHGLFVVVALNVSVVGLAAPLPAEAKFTEAEVEAKLAHLNELCQKNLRAEVVAEFKDEDFSAWLTAFKDKNVGISKIRRALQLRGTSLANQKEYELAKKDYMYALELSPSDGHAWSSLGSVYRRMNDDEKALAAFNKAFECQQAAQTGKSFNVIPISATLEAASILMNQTKYPEALKTLERYNDDDIPKMGTYWGCRMLRAYGQVYAATGREEEALAKFKTALELEKKQGE